MQATSRLFSTTAGLLVSHDTEYSAHVIWQTVHKQQQCPITEICTSKVWSEDVKFVIHGLKKKSVYRHNDSPWTNLSLFSFFSYWTSYFHLSLDGFSAFLALKMAKQCAPENNIWVIYVLALCVRAKDGVENDGYNVMCGCFECSPVKKKKKNAEPSGENKRLTTRHNSDVF